MGTLSRDELVDCLKNLMEMEGTDKVLDATQQVLADRAASARENWPDDPTTWEDHELDGHAVRFAHEQVVTRQTGDIEALKKLREANGVVRKENWRLYMEQVKNLPTVENDQPTTPVLDDQDRSLPKSFSQQLEAASNDLDQEAGPPDSE